MDKKIIEDGIIECFSNIGIFVDEKDLKILDLQDYIEDSIMFITFIIELESKFNIEFPDEYLNPNLLNSYDMLVEILEKLLLE